jgi:CRISPR-associated endonuclease/helicase Cas3
MNHLSASDFPDFFQAMWGYPPFPWQARLAEQVCVGYWPNYLDLPTGSGKTVCLDIAVFALAVQAALAPEDRTVGRRIFFVVNRRVIVDEAHRRSTEMAAKLEASMNGDPKGILTRVARALSLLSATPERESAPSPLDVVQLRGGIYRDNRWARSLTQPTVIASTVDQVGSRLLFRGYGLSPGACPIHAALVAQDSLLLLDEAHISRPFAQTIAWVKRYREFRDGREMETERLRPAPFHFVQLTATHAKGNDSDEIPVFGLNDLDRSNERLSARLHAKKPAKLEVAIGAKGKQATIKLATALSENALAIIEKNAPRSLAVIVNRVATAREVASLLEKEHPKCVTLLIGRMRPLDRDAATLEISNDLKTGARSSSEVGEKRPPRIVVATQCLEVGADLDFDALVTECASIDALRQRFGRLNRAGDNFIPTASILMREDLIEQLETKLIELDKAGKQLDPVYGNALSRTWNWLQTQRDGEDANVDFSIHALGTALAKLPTEQAEKLNAPSPDAPILMPAYLDAWVQTNPRPVPDPDPAIFLHGPDNSQPEVQVCWRADLPDPPDFAGLSEPEEATAKRRLSFQWQQAISLCPPLTTECLAVPLAVFKDWLFNRQEIEDSTGDLLSGKEPPAGGDSFKQQAFTATMAWRSSGESAFIEFPNQVRPNDTVVIPVSAGGWSRLGHVPGAPGDPSDLKNNLLITDQTELSNLDLAETAFEKRRRRQIMRIRRNLIPTKLHGVFKDLLDWAEDLDSNWTVKYIREALKEAANHLDATPDFANKLKQLANEDLGLLVTRYADGRGVCLQNRRVKSSAEFDPLDDEDDLLSAAESDRVVNLVDHTRHVEVHVRSSTAALPVGGFSGAIIAAAVCHDWGKVDPRFQALLMRGDTTAAGALREPIAKSPQLARTPHERERARLRSALPKGFRHEMLSLQLAQKSGAETGILPGASSLRDLSLHLIASHHGHARPFAPVVLDDDIQDALLPLSDLWPELAMTSEERDALPAHRLDSGVAERFWSLTRVHGWWGLAYLETILRISDQRASESEGQNSAQ